MSILVLFNNDVCVPAEWWYWMHLLSNCYFNLHVSDVFSVLGSVSMALTWSIKNIVIHQDLNILSISSMALVFQGLNYYSCKVYVSKLLYSSLCFHKFYTNHTWPTPFKYFYCFLACMSSEDRFFHIMKSNCFSHWIFQNCVVKSDVEVFSRILMVCLDFTEHVSLKLPNFLGIHQLYRSYQKTYKLWNRPHTNVQPTINKGFGKNHAKISVVYGNVHLVPDIVAVNFS